MSKMLSKQYKIKSKKGNYKVSLVFCNTYPKTDSTKCIENNVTDVTSIKAK